MKTSYLKCKNFKIDHSWVTGLLFSKELNFPDFLWPCDCLLHCSIQLIKSEVKRIHDTLVKVSFQVIRIQLKDLFSIHCEYAANVRQPEDQTFLA